MFNSSGTSLMVNLRLTVIHPLILLIISSVFAVVGLPLRSSSSTDSRPLLKRSYQRKTFDLVRVLLPKHFSNISKVCAPLNRFLTQNLMQTRCCKVDDIFFLWKIETTHKDKCTQYGVTLTNVKLSSWKADRTSMTLLPTQQKKNWNPNFLSPKIFLSRCIVSVAFVLKKRSPSTVYTIYRIRYFFFKEHTPCTVYVSCLKKHGICVVHWYLFSRSTACARVVRNVYLISAFF